MAYSAGVFPDYRFLACFSVKVKVTRIGTFHTLEMKRRHKPSGIFFTILQDQESGLIYLYKPCGLIQTYIIYLIKCTFSLQFYEQRILTNAQNNCCHGDKDKQINMKLYKSLYKQQTGSSSITPL